ncbi:MAG: penicillin acylase family protein, partial [bacterium]|nr:penicillin acylase family protein [bacterium]
MESKQSTAIPRRVAQIAAGLTLVVLLAWQVPAPFWPWNAAGRVLPVVDGSLEVEGLASSITIRRDSRGVPHIRARGEADGWFGLGFAHAQDRLGQLLWLRRLARGTSAEISGRAALPVDRLVRTLGIGWHADAEASELNAANAPALFAYAAGVNARLARLGRDAVRTLLDAPANAPEEAPWSPADSIALIKLLNWTMGPSLEAGVVFAELVETLGGVGARPLLPTGLGMKGVGLAFELPNGKPLRTLRRGARRRQKSDLARSRSQLAGTSLQVGAWVVSGDDSESGSPLLAAEFQLAPTVPVLVYEAHLSAPGLDTVGATIPGIPVYWTGRNANVAWALTPGRANTVQLYHETLRRVGEMRQALSGRHWVPLRERDEVIRVRTLGGDFSEEPLRVESTRHGPLINDLIAAAGDPLALEWTGAGRGDGLRALVSLVHATDADDLVARLAGHHEPVLAVAYADRAGSVGWQMAGWLPKRLLGTAHLPTPGEQLGFDWEERLRFALLPNSASHDSAPRWIVAADNPLLKGAMSRQIEWTWRSGLRGRGIDRALSRLRAEGRIDLRELAAMQSKLTAQVSPRVIQSLESLLGRVPDLSPEAEEVWKVMRSWDGRFEPDRRGAAVYRVFVHDLIRKLLESKIPAALVDRYLALAGVEPRVLVEGALLEASSSGRPGGWRDPELLASLL